MGKKKNLIYFLIGIVAIIAVAIVLYVSRVFVPDTLKLNSTTTKSAEVGDVVSTIEATGVVESENEVLVLSPAASVVKRILIEPGSRVKEGDILIELDRENVILEIESIQDQLEMKRNNLEKTSLNAQSVRLDLSYNEEVKKLKIVSLESQLTDQQQLLEVGGISPARIEQTKQEITLAEKDLEMLKEKNEIRLKQLEAEEQGLLLQITVQEKQLDEKRRLLEKMDIKAPSSGIILSLSAHTGEKVNQDTPLIRMSDLSSFKVSGSVDENYAEKIKTGKTVLVTLDGEQLEGLIGNVTPMVENNKIQFNVHLAQSSHPKLIANQQVEIKIITNHKENVVRLPKWEGFETKDPISLFVIEGSKAVKRNVNIGIVGNDYVEINSGLNAGDVVVVDGINAYRHLAEVEVE